MTPAELDAIEARAKAGVEGILSEGGGPAFDALESVEEDVPALVAEVRRLQELVAKVTEAAMELEDGSIRKLLYYYSVDEF
jgi:hypothetical protein